MSGESFAAAESVCPQCGLGAPSDEDGCCATCGATLLLPEVLVKLEERALERHLRTLTLDAAERGIAILPCLPTCATAKLQGSDDLELYDATQCDCGLSQQRATLAKALDDARDQGALEMRGRAQAFVLKCREASPDVVQVFDVLADHIGRIAVRP